ncbi:hypothetical protein [Enterococcus rotai]|uniref:hypothetical protein n=1 Tax=Enterococcus rotai TaxID=118060 RepID=UPI0035C667FF
MLPPDLFGFADANLLAPAAVVLFEKWIDKLLSGGDSMKKLLFATAVTAGTVVKTVGVAQDKLCI